MSTSRCLLLHCYCCWLVGSHIIQKTDYWTHTSNRKIHTLCTICTFFLSHSVSYNQHNNPLADWLNVCILWTVFFHSVYLHWTETNRTEPFLLLLSIHVKAPHSRNCTAYKASLFGCVRQCVSIWCDGEACALFISLVCSMIFLLAKVETKYEFQNIRV